MRVQNEQLTGTACGQTTRASGTQAGKAGESQRSQGTGGRDQVSISNAAAQFGRLESSLSAGHASRVEELTRAYREGRYSVDPQKLGSRIVEEWLANGAGAGKPEGI